MDPPSKLVEQKLPPLLALPVELKWQIISHLDHDEYPSLACLRRTHSSFLNVIPKAQIRSELSDTELSNQLLKTELDYAYLLPVVHYPCYICARVLPIWEFATTPCRRSDRLDDEPYWGRRSCEDCCMLKTSSYRRSFIESLVWIGTTLEELPTPPLRPRLRSGNETSVKVMTEDLFEHMRNLRQQAQDHGAETSLRLARRDS
ncbi:hypothetical protein HO133_006375 [Letharia lupina]|uniref:F-box domain-containing protein n=1 Tax=Letharia lupina TaxID=560253 RepID=A0A8H6C6N8_9LECA|nr:uncharacterized protein HO133_006375 [Letharia lupina]KAF6217963.1 hypothetical protein HO133_006375 [Letharia lupina]